MIEGLVLLLVFQLLGNVAEMYFHLPVPGSVLGMFLLLIALIANDRLASWVRPISLVLISYLAVLFVPAGVGIMLQISHKFFKKVTKPLGIELGEAREYGVGMFFFPQDELARNQAKKMLEVIVQKEGLKFLGWRTLPTHPEEIGDKAVEKMPYIMQGFIGKPAEVEKGLDFDRRL